MEIIYEDQYFQLFFDSSKRILTSISLDGNEKLTEEELKTDFMLAAELITTYKPAYYISDNRNQKFVFDVEIQNWAATTILTPCVMAGTKKFAILLPNDLMAQMSLEQTADEVKLPIEISYFSSVVDAMKWFGF